MTTILAIFGVAGATTSSSPSIKKIAILPFTMNSDRDLKFLQSGIMDMLSSRLAWKDKIEVIEKGSVLKEVDASPGPMDKQEALEIGKALGADYVILGSLTVFGDSVSIDAKILDVAKGEELVTAFEQSKGMDGVIPTVNKFAEDINAKVMGKYVPEQESRPAAVKEEPGALLSSDQGAGGSKAASYVKRFKLEIRGLGVGDLEGDGTNALVMIDKNTVYVYKWIKNTLSEIAAIKGSWSPNYAYVSVADMDRNGRAEIYVSDLTVAGVSSFVLEWDGSKFKEIIRGQKWLFRVVELPGRGRTLVGQERVVEGSYVGDVFTLVRQGDNLTAGEPIKLPRGGNVFNFVKADLTGKGGDYTTLLSPYEHLELYDGQGTSLWKSDDYFGGTLVFIEYMDYTRNRMARTPLRVFLPSPIFLSDVDGDGKEEVVVCQNISKTARTTEDFRWFGSGKVHFMAWDGVGLNTVWTSQKLSGTVVGYEVADLDQDGRNELIIASVTSESYFVGFPKSRLVMYDLK